MFSEDYGTHRFYINIHGQSNYSGNIFIAQGNYSSGAALVSAINAALGNVPNAALNGAAQPSNFVNFVYEPNSNQVIIELISDADVSFEWYIEDALVLSALLETPNSLLEPPKQETKWYNLGWLLGFRTQNFS